jgi:hypothetical protein
MTHGKHNFKRYFKKSWISVHIFSPHCCSWLNDCVSQYLSTSFRPWEEPFSLLNITSPQSVQITSRHLQNKTQPAYPRGHTITAKEPVGGGSPANAVHSSHPNFGSAKRQSETSRRLCTVSVDRALRYSSRNGVGFGWLRIWKSGRNS